MKKNKLEIILILTILLVGSIGTTLAYFASKFLLEGNESKTSVKTAKTEDTIIKVEGDIETEDIGKYPGHKSISRIKVTATGEKEVPFNLIWTGINTLNTQVNYTIYKTTEPIDVKISCEEKNKEAFEESLGLFVYYYEDCTTDVSKLGKEIGTGVLNASEDNENISFGITELIQATKEGAVAYYYALFEIPNLDKNQNIDMNGKIKGEFSIEIAKNYTQAYKKILADNDLKTSEIDYSNPEPIKKYIELGLSDTLTDKDTAIVYYSNYYFTYANEYTYNESTASYSLVDPKVGKYSDIYENLSGKYIVALSGSTSSSIASYTDISTIYKVLGTPDMKSFNYTSSADNFVAEKAKDLHQHKYVYYSNSYTFDENEGKFKLNSPTKACWLDIYDDIEGKYITSAGPIVRPTTAARTTIYKIVKASENNVSYYELTNEMKLIANYTGLFKSEDDDGDSYFFRGSVTNNYVRFGKYASDYSDSALAGKDMYWRIIRINGDKTIRLIYDGDMAYANDVSSKSKGLNYSSYSGASDNTYVGFMHGASPSKTYEDAHSNKGSSSIKNSLDKWYRANLKNYENYIDKNAGFCGDRSLASGTGIGSDITQYKAYERLITNKLPTLKCSNKERDFYTIKAATKGNKALTYPIGLITADEVAMAGALNGYNNTLYYLNGFSTWTITPFEFNSNAYIFTTQSLNRSVTNSISVGAKPVINLRSNVMFSGSGTMDDPYTIS